MTILLHRFAGANAFDQKALEAELDYIVHSVAGRTTLAENYVGLPFED
jgi:p-hydroxybenzoate 3-monooxygenase